jgi:hypothetical protein
MGVAPESVKSPLSVGDVPYSGERLILLQDKVKFRQFLLGININLETRPKEIENPKTELTDVEDVHDRFFNESEQFISKNLGDHILNSQLNRS